LGVGASFAGAALIVLGLTGSALLSAAVFAIGIVITVVLLVREPVPTPLPVNDVEQAIIDLRAEKAATDTVLRRAARRRVTHSTKAR
jgi:hypothetical protein